MLFSVAFSMVKICMFLQVVLCTVDLVITYLKPSFDVNEPRSVEEVLTLF